MSATLCGRVRVRAHARPYDVCMRKDMSESVFGKGVVK